MANHSSTTHEASGAVRHPCKHSGADPVAVLQRVQALAGQGALLDKGKHDAMAVRPPAESKTEGGSTTDWTHAQLGSSQLAFLDSLPLLREHGSTALVHASLGHPRRGLR